MTVYLTSFLIGNDVQLGLDLRLRLTRKSVNMCFPPQTCIRD